MRAPVGGGPNWSPRYPQLFGALLTASDLLALVGCYVAAARVERLAWKLQ